MANYFTSLVLHSLTLKLHTQESGSFLTPCHLSPGNEGRAPDLYLPESEDNGIEDGRELRNWKNDQGESKLFKARRAIKMGGPDVFLRFPGKLRIV